LGIEECVEGVLKWVHRRIDRFLEVVIQRSGVMWMLVQVTEARILMKAELGHLGIVVLSREE
jgi:hypothetical protein